MYFVWSGPGRFHMKLCLEKYVYFDEERPWKKRTKPNSCFRIYGWIKVNTYPNILVGREFIFLAKLLILIM